MKYKIVRKSVSGMCGPYTAEKIVQTKEEAEKLVFNTNDCIVVEVSDDTEISDWRIVD